MTRWIVAPLLAATLLAGSGFLSSLEGTTNASARLAAESAEAPEETREAVVGLRSVPAVAALTGRQVRLAEVLGAALRASAERLDRVVGSLGEQVGELEELRGHLDEVGGRLGCVRERARSLLGTSSRTPEALEEVAGSLRRIARWQEKSIRHLRSINRKLAALGVVATGTGVEPLPTPSPPPTPTPEAARGSVPC